MANIFTDKKGVFQGGEQGRLLGRLRDTIEGMLDRRNNPPSKQPNTVPGVSDQGLLQNVTQNILPGSNPTSLPVGYKPQEFHRNPNNPRYRAFPQEETGGNPLYGGASVGYRQIGATDEPLSPSQQANADIAKYKEDNPDATSQDIRRFANERNQQKIKELKSQYETKRLASSAGTRDKMKEKNAQDLNIINVPDEQLANMNWVDLKKYQMNEKESLRKLMDEGYSESDAIKIISKKFNLMDKIRGLKLRDIGTGKNLRRLRNY